VSALKDGRYEIELDKKRYLLFDLNVIDELNEKYGGYDKLGEVLDAVKNPHYIKDLKWILTLLINEGAEENDPELTERQVGKLINTGNMDTALTSVFAAFSIGITGGQVDENPKIAAMSAT